MNITKNKVKYTKKITEYTYNNITMKEMIKIGDFIYKKIEPKPDGFAKISRSGKRNKKLLIEWFENNWEVISSIFCQIVPVNEYGNKISNFDPKNFHWKLEDKDEEDKDEEEKEKEELAKTKFHDEYPHDFSESSDNEEY